MHNFVLANRMRPHIGKFRQILRPHTFLNRKSPPCSGILFATEDVHRPTSDSSLLVDVITFGKCEFVWKHRMLVLGVCLVQTHSSAGSMFAASRSSLDYYPRNDSAFV